MQWGQTADVTRCMPLKGTKMLCTTGMSTVSQLRLHDMTIFSYQIYLIDILRYTEILPAILMPLASLLQQQENLINHTQ